MAGDFDMDRKPTDGLILPARDPLQRAWFDAVGVGLLVVRDVVIDCNSAALAIHRRARDEILGRTLAELGSAVHPDDSLAFAWLQEMERRAIAGHPQVFDLRIVDADGSPHELEVELRVLRLEGEACLLATERDVTEVRRTLRALGDAEELFRGVVAAAQGGVVVYDRDLRYVYWNRCMEEITGVPAKAAIGKTAGEVFPHVRPYDIEKVHRRALAGETVTSPDVWNPGTVRGKRGWTFGVYAPRRNANGDIIGVVGTVHDITRRKEAEAADKLKSDALENSLNGVALLERDCTLRYANRAYLRMRGYLCLADAQQVNAADQFVDPTVKQQIFDDLDRHGTCVREAAVRRTDGTTFEELLSVRPLTDQAANELLICTSIDISERKQAEAALRLTQFCVDHASVGILQLAEDGRIVDANQQMCAYLGYTREALGALAVADIDNDHPKERWPELRAALYARRSVTYETRLRCQSGSLLPVEITATYVDYAGQRVFVCFVRDIRERIKAEEDRGKLEAQLRHAQKMEAVGQLAGGVAHDFNNILTTILGNVELSSDRLRRTPLDPAALAANLTEIAEAAQRAANLTRQLLTFSRRDVARPELLDLNVTLNALQNMLRRVITAQIQLEFSLTPDLWLVRADAGQLEQVIMNLVVNARDAMPDGGSLVLETANVTLDADYVATHAEARIGRHVRVSISDTGAGIDASTVERIFEPFFTTKPSGVGTGLGLAIVYGIVKQAGGHVLVYSEPGRGTTFRLYFPAAAGAESEPRAYLSESAPPTGCERILLCEDDATVRLLTATLLEGAGYTVLTAADGAAAVRTAAAAGEAVDLLVTDVILPDANGKQIAAELAAMTPDLRILYISGYTANVIAHHGVLDEGVTLLEKPFSRARLLHAVRTVLDGPVGKTKSS